MDELFTKYQPIEKPTTMYTWLKCTKQIFENVDDDVNLMVSEFRIRWRDDMNIQTQYQAKERKQNCNWKVIYLHVLKATPT